MDEKSLSHTKWKCQYHVVVVPKFRRKMIYGKLRRDIGKILRQLCDFKHVEIIEAHAMLIISTCCYQFRQNWQFQTSWGI